MNYLLVVQVFVRTPVGQDYVELNTDERFELLYGRGELAAERGASHMGLL